MDELGPAPALNGLERHAQKLQPSLVEVIQVSIRTRTVQHGRSRVDDETQAFFGLFQVRRRLIPWLLRHFSLRGLQARGRFSERWTGHARRALDPASA